MDYKEKFDRFKTFRNVAGASKPYVSVDGTLNYKMKVKMPESLSRESLPSELEVDFKQGVDKNS